jgi:hypothetical protein
VCRQAPWLLGSEHISVDMTEAPITGAHLLPQVEASTAVNLRVKDAASGEFWGGVRALTKPECLILPIHAQLLPKLGARSLSSNVSSIPAHAT